MRKIIILMAGMSMLMGLGLPVGEASPSSECFMTLHSAEIGLTDRQMNDACEDIVKTGEAYIEDFRDRGLIIKFITLGESVTIPLSM